MDHFKICFYTFLLIGFISTNQSFGGMHNYDIASISKILDGKDLKVSSRERRLANNLAKVYEITEQGYINISLTKKVLKESRNYSAFHIYKGWLKSIIAIHSKTTAASLRSTCNSLIKNKANSELESELQNNSVLMCFSQYLKKLSGRHKVAPKHHRKDRAFFEKRVDYITHPSNTDSLSYFFSRFKRGSSTWKAYSKAVADHYIKAQKAPTKKLLQYMDITPELTRFIQVQGLKDDSAKYVLYRELRKLIDKAFDDANDKKSDKEVAKSLGQALSYYTLSYPHLPQGKSNERILSLGKSLSRRSYFKSARKAFEAIEKLSPGNEDAVFETMWTYITQEKYRKAFSHVISKHKLHENYGSLNNDRLQFWTAYTLKQIGKDLYKDIFEDLISKSALNYYSIMASKQLTPHYDMPSEKIYFHLANKEASEGMKMPKVDSEILRALKRFKIWGAMDFKPMISLEKQNVYDLINKKMANKDETSGRTKSALLLLSAAVLNQEENYLESFKMIYKGLRGKVIGLNDTVLDILFPKPYFKQVSSHIKGFDPLIALSLIRQESGFNHKARSWVGARGLMQLMPTTARMYSSKLKTKHLYNPKVNIKIGSQYLTMLLEKYENNLVYALSAYNAGESRVKRWRKNYMTQTSSILHNIENIPFLETQKYVKLIFRNLFFYKMRDEKVEIADSDKVNEIFDIQLGFNQ